MLNQLPDAVPAAIVPPPVKPQRGRPKSKPALAGWKANLQLDRRGDIRSTVRNALIYLQHDPKLSGSYRLNDFAKITERQDSQGDFKRLRDSDVTRLRMYLQGEGFHDLTEADTRRALLTYAEEYPHHPVRDYLESLPEWDGTERLKSWLHLCVGAEDSIRIAETGKRFLIAAIARIMQPGCKHDGVLVLEGAQGKGKSTLCKVLVGDSDWFTDDMKSPEYNSGKDASQGLRGKWIVEIAENAAFSRSEAVTLKAFITREVDKYRPPHGREDVVEPRQCVFVMTTNETTYINDPTGGRRWWPVEVCKDGPMNLRYLSEIRDQLFAEALALYRSGEPWHMDSDFEAEHMHPVQAERQEVDPWSDKIQEFLENERKVKVKVTEIAEGPCLGLSNAQLGKREQARIIGVLKRLGWEAKRTEFERFWVRKE